MAEVVSKVVTRYACSTCGRSYSRKATAALHITHCPKEVSSRACATCRHDGTRDDPGCMKLARPVGLPCIYNCPSWEAARSHLTNVVDVYVTDRPAGVFDA